MPQDRLGRFSTELFERYQRSEKALVGTLAEMYVQGVSTRKVKAVTEALVRPQFFGIGDQRDQQIARRGSAGVCRAAAERELSLSDPRCALREGARGRGHRQPGGAGRGGGRRGRPAPDPGSRARQPREPIELARLSLGAQSPRARRRRVCRQRRPSRVSRRRSARCCRRRPGSAAMCIFSETRSTMCRARSTTTACGSCAGFTTAAISPKCAATSPPGWPNGRPSTRGCATGSRTTSRRR